MEGRLLACLRSNCVFVLLSVRSFIAWTLDRLVDRWSRRILSILSVPFHLDLLRLYKFSLVSNRNQTFRLLGDPSMQRSDLIFDLVILKKLTRNMFVFEMKYRTPYFDILNKYRWIIEI